jgi:hypothetical protein
MTATAGLGYVYFLPHLRLPCVKIGRTRSYASRYRRLARRHPFRREDAWIAVFDAGLEVRAEAMLKRRLKGSRFFMDPGVPGHTEWFHQGSFRTLRRYVQAQAKQLKYREFRPLRFRARTPREERVVLGRKIQAYLQVLCNDVRVIRLVGRAAARGRAGHSTMTIEDWDDCWWPSSVLLLSDGSSLTIDPAEITVSWNAKQPILLPSSPDASDRAGQTAIVAALVRGVRKMINDKRQPAPAR